MLLRKVSLTWNKLITFVPVNFIKIYYSDRL